MWFAALAMTLVGDLSKGSLGASKVSVSLRVLSIRRSGKEKKKNQEEEEGERFMLYLRVSVSRGVMPKDSCFLRAAVFQRVQACIGTRRE